MNPSQYISFNILIIQKKQFDSMSAKTSSLMKNAQIQKTKQTIEHLLQWYSKKEEFFKRYVPIQQSLIKKLISCPQITLTRLKEIGQIVAEEKELQAHIFQKTQKAILIDQTKFMPKIQEKIDPKDPKGTSKIQQQLPTWNNNIDRILLSMSRSFKQRKSRVKQIYKTLDSIQSELSKEENRYRAQVKKEQKQLQKLFDRFDQFQKESSKTLAKIIKESKGDNIKDSAFFIGQIKSIQKNLNGEFDCFVQRNKIIVKLVQIIIRNEKISSKKIKDQLTIFLNYKRQNTGKETKIEEEIWGFLSIAQEKIQQERLKYFNLMLLKPERIEMLKAIIEKTEFKNNWQVIVKFIEMTKVDLMKPISAQEEINKLLKNISYRCWLGISLAQGWLIESYTSAVLYMTYDYIMIIYTLQGDLLKKIHTNSSKVKKTQGQTLYLQQKIKGFFSDSIEEYKIKFQDIERMQQFQLFIENQVK